MDTPFDLQTNAGLLILEIGNSHVSVATCVAGQICTRQRFGHDQAAETLDHAVEAWSALPGDRLKAIVAASVVPRRLEALRAAIVERLGAPVLVVGRDLHRPMSLAVEAPELVGIDRICSAAAAHDVIGGACVVASFGTAITIDCVNGEGVFMGGAILPGLAMQARSLSEGTASLPLVSIHEPRGVYGANTEEAICNGVVFGVVGALREITERYATDLKAWPQLVATGGNADLIGRHCDFVDNIVPDLCLRGIALAYRRHFAAFDD